MRARYLSLRPRLGHKKAIIAVAAAMLRSVYHMLKDGTFYQDLGPDYRRPKNPQRAANNLANKSEPLALQSNSKLPPDPMFQERADPGITGFSTEN